MSEVNISKQSELTDTLVSPSAACLLEDTNKIVAIERIGNFACKVFNINTNECVYSFGNYQTGQFSYLVSICLIGSVVCVADYRRMVIMLFTNEGDCISEVHLLANPWSLCYSNNSLNLYITFLFTNKVMRISSELPYQLVIGKGILVQPLCVCVNEQEIIFVLDKTTKVTYFQEDGDILGNISFEKIDPWCSESLVTFVIDKKENFILCPSSINSILVFTGMGNQIFPKSNEQRRELNFDNPLHIHLDSRCAILLVCDTYNGRIQIFDYYCH